MTARNTDTATAILLVSCPDRKGLVAGVSDFIFRNNGNILHADQHIDSETSIFFQRVEWALDGFGIPRERIAEAFRPLAERSGMAWDLRVSDSVPRMALLVSRYEHCLYDLLLRQRSGEFKATIPLVLSNHPDLQPIVDGFGAAFHCVPLSAETRAAAERRMLEVLREHRVDCVVLARYMRILSGDFVGHYPNRIINIHHSFLPAFAGSRPYHQAFDRGVKLIGATAHYVTAQLDEGPIIEQGVARASHRDSVGDLIRKGRDLEKLVLARAVALHLGNRVLVYGNKTVVFD